MSGAQEVSRFRSEMAIPERNMTFFAGMLASLEKLTSMLGKLNGIWATTVLLGGFPTTLEENDFWYVTVILAAEGIRIFGRSGELKTGYSHLDSVIRLCSFVIQYCSAGVFLVFSSRALIPADYGPEALTPAEYGPSVNAGNRNVALKLFYFMSTVESGMILAGLFLRILSGIAPKVWSSEGKRRGCFPAILISRRVLEVKRKYNLDDSQIKTLYRFFHPTYSRCVSGSFFDSRKITIVSYSVELLQSSNGDEQLNGATLLSGLVKKYPRALERLRSSGTIRNVVEMLIEMLNWDSEESPEKGIRVAAAESIESLVQIGRNGTLVMAAPNSIESITSLLDDGNQVESNSSQNRTQSSPEYPYSDLSKVGLRILNQLANDHDNRAKMGSNRELLLKIIRLTESNAAELDLKELAIKTLTSIARDQEFRESIGGTDGVLHNFYSLFFANFNIDNRKEKELVSTAGEALGFLSLENHHNCEILMNFPHLIEELISALNNSVQDTYAARILRNLYAHLEANSVELEANSVNLNKIRAASAEVVQLAKAKDGVHQEAAIGLAAQIFKFPKFPSPADYELVFGEQGGAPSLISKLRDVLQHHASPSKELPNIRRFSILLLIAIMKTDIRLTIGNELRMNLMDALKEAIKTTSVLESYSTFSGTVGLSSHRMSIPFLAYSAMDLLHPEPGRRHRRQYPEPIEVLAV